MMSLGKEIRKARIDRGLRQGQLAVAAAVSQKYMSQIENDHADPSFSIVQRIAKALEVSLDQLGKQEQAGCSRRGIREIVKTSQGYLKVYCPEHPHAYRDGYVLQHILIAEKALGSLLPTEAVVHHANEDRSNNRGSNLVICENQAFHQLLHRRMKALKECGHADWRHCWVCDGWFPPDDPDIVIKHEGRFQQERIRHTPCRKQQDRKRWHARKPKRLAASMPQVSTSDAASLPCENIEALQQDLQTLAQRYAITMQTLCRIASLGAVLNPYCGMYAVCDKDPV